VIDLFFEKEIVSVRLLNVIHYKQGPIVAHEVNKKHALSFRFATDASIQTKEKFIQMQAHSVTYMPSGLHYSKNASHDDLIVIDFQPDECCTSDCESFVTDQPDKLAPLFMEIYDCWLTQKTGYLYQCTALLYNILAECHKQVTEPSKDSFRISQSVEYIHNHYRDSELTVEKAAACSCVSAVYFRKLFKAQFGLSPQKYIENLRMNYAISLMQSGIFKIKEIAYMSGYSDYKYFSVFFRKYMGISPSEYCQQYFGMMDSKSNNEHRPAEKE